MCFWFKKFENLCSSSQDAVVINKIISRELLESLLIIGTGIEQDKYIITNSKTNSIPFIR